MARSSPKTTRPLAPRLPPELTDGGDVSLEDDEEWHELALDGDWSDAEADDVEIVTCSFTRAVLTGVRLERVRITDTVFTSCELSGAMFESAVLTRVAFHDCRMSGFVASRAQLRDVVFDRCRLDVANFRMATGDRVELDHCDLTSAELTNAKINGLRMTDCDLSRTELSQAQLPGVRLHGSRVDTLKGAMSLKGAIIGSEQVHPLALRLLDALKITVDDEPEADPDER